MQCRSLLLVTVKMDFGTLKKITLGQRNAIKNKTILLVGETGAGKSTLINALVNYALGVEFEENIWFEIVEDEKIRQTESQTSDVIVYEIFGFEGIEHDLIVSQRLFDLFRSNDGVHAIDAVGLVMKASESRLSDRLRYIFDSVMSLFGKDLEENIVALITHSNGRKPTNALKALEAAEIKCAKNVKNEPVHFVFDNCQNEERTEDIEDLKHSDRVTMKGLSEFTDFLEKAAPQKLEKTVDVLNERITLTACINNLQERIEFIKLKRQEIQQTQEALKIYEQKVNKNKNFTIEVDEPYKESEPIESQMWWWVFYQGAVCCKVCEENCHYPGCTVAWYPDRCEVMKSGHCTVCTGKCPVSDHVKENWRFVTKTRKVEKTLNDVKEKYNKNKVCEKTSSLLENLQRELENLEANKIQLLDEAYKHTMNLEKIALNVYSLSTYVHLDFLIEEMMERKENTEKIRNLKQIASQMNEGLQAGLKYMYSKVSDLFRFIRKVDAKRGTEV
uniref:Uncharacterized protein n=1 Tax=Anabas testudineus TaxID=64144 RepID=A0A3Q1J587_ANATE